MNKTPLPPPKQATKPQQVASQGFDFSPRKPKSVPSRVMLYARPGWGKTTVAAHCKSPLIVMANGETGYDTLLAADRVPSVPAVEVVTWQDVVRLIRQLVENPQGIKTLCFDAVGGFEDLCHQFVCDRDFGGEWGEKGFGAFQRGYEVGSRVFATLLTHLEHLQRLHGIDVLWLAHSEVKPFRNPKGEDYDRYLPVAHKTIWRELSGWVDALLFGDFDTCIKKARGATKGKAVGGTQRVIYTSEEASHEAKNRYGMPSTIDVPENPSSVAGLIYKHIHMGGTHAG